MNYMCQHAAAEELTVQPVKICHSYQEANGLIPRKKKKKRLILSTIQSAEACILLSFKFKFLQCCSLLISYKRLLKRGNNVVCFYLNLSKLTLRTRIHIQNSINKSVVRGKLTAAIAVIDEASK